MDFADVVRSRRMVRAFEPRPVPGAVLERVLDLARRVPAAGNTQGLDLVVLEGPEQTARYWDATLPPERREAFPWPKLLDAPVLIIPVGAPGAYVERYGEPDKAATGLGEGPGAWPVPYWYVDTAFAAMVALLAAVDEGLGALFFGQFEHEDGGRGRPRHPPGPPPGRHHRPRLRRVRRRPAQPLGAAPPPSPRRDRPPRPLVAHAHRPAHHHLSSFLSRFAVTGDRKARQEREGGHRPRGQGMRTAAGRRGVRGWRAGRRGWRRRGRGGRTRGRGTRRPGRRARSRRGPPRAVSRCARPRR